MGSFAIARTLYNPLPMRFSDFDHRLSSLGALPVHRGRLARVWLNGQALDQGTRRRKSEDFLPLAVRDAVPSLTAELDALARVRSEHSGQDGSRLLVELADGQMVESVLLPRDGLCVSTQVGCAVGCRFYLSCKSGSRPHNRSASTRITRRGAAIRFPAFDRQRASPAAASHHRQHAQNGYWLDRLAHPLAPE